MPKAKPHACQVFGCQAEATMAAWCPVHWPISRPLRARCRCGWEGVPEVKVIAGKYSKRGKPQIVEWFHWTRGGPPEHCGPVWVLGDGAGAGGKEAAPSVPRSLESSNGPRQGRHAG
jgi:hypothetical protein